MTPPLWVLLAFAVWTILVLMAGTGIRRWTLIFAGRAQLTDFPGDQPHGSAAYRRAVRAHANCVENLPVYGAVAVAAFAAGIDTPLLDALAIAYMAARLGQTLVHMLFAETNRTVLIRFLLFAPQLVCVLAMAAVITIAAASA